MCPRMDVRQEAWRSCFLNRSSHTHLSRCKHLSSLGVTLMNTLYKPEPTDFPTGLIVGNTNLLWWWRKTCIDQAEMLQYYISWAIKEIFKGSFWLYAFSTSQQGFRIPPPPLAAVLCCVSHPLTPSQNVNRSSHMSQSSVPYKILLQGTWTQMTSIH